jgi:hypothetical protein
MAIILKHLAFAATLLALAGGLPAKAQEAASAAAPAMQTNYDENLKCLGVYSFMAAAERAAPPATIQVYFGLIASDGHALGKTDAQIKADAQTAMMAYTQTVIAPISKNNQIPADAGWADYRTCNSYFAGRGVVATTPATAQPQ